MALPGLYYDMMLALCDRVDWGFADAPARVHDDGIRMIMTSKTHVRVPLTSLGVK